MKPIAIIQHVSTDGTGYFSTWAEAQGLDFEVFRMYDGASLPARIEDYAGLCILGGPMSANDPIAYFPRLLEQINECMAKGIPVIGHCLGGQLMSRALGGTVQDAENAEIGWSDLEVMNELGHAWFGADKQLPLFQWHGESFSIPPGAVQVVRGRYCANQAYVVNGLHLGMQFHCEVDDFKVNLWVERDEAEITAAAHSPGVQKVSDIVPNLPVDMPKSQAIASHIYNKWAQGLRR